MPRCKARSAATNTKVIAITGVPRLCFSSIRRHTRFDCDWSSDVCSSDLERENNRQRQPHVRQEDAMLIHDLGERIDARCRYESDCVPAQTKRHRAQMIAAGKKRKKRMEERRVGEKGRYRGERDNLTKKT